MQRYKGLSLSWIFIFFFSFPLTVSLADDLKFDQDSVADSVTFHQGQFGIAASLAGSILKSCGTAGDTPLSGRFLLDGIEELGVYNSSFGFWQICGNSTSDAFFWGVPGDIPVAADYDGDGLTDPSIYRRATGEWYILFNRFGKNAGKSNVVKFGLPTDIPVPADYDGDGQIDIAIFRQNPTGGANWFIKFSSGEVKVKFGLLGDIPVPADYNGDGKIDIAVWRPNEGNWYIHQGNKTLIKQWGLPGDTPNPADIDGDGKADFVVFRPSSGMWFRSSQKNEITLVKLGQAGDKVVGALSALHFSRKVPDDFDGDGFSDLSIARKTQQQTLQFLIYKGANLTGPKEFGKSGDLFANGDYDGDGLTDLALAREENSVLVWHILLSSAQTIDNSSKELIVTYGQAGDQLIPADYDGDLKTDLAVIRNTANGNKMWLPNNSGANFLNPVMWGFSSDKALVADVDGDGKADFIVVRELNDELLWLVRTANGQVLQPKLYGFKDDQVMIGDFNGDGKAEFAVIRKQNGFKLVIIEGQQPFIWGLEGDLSFAGNFLGSPGLEQAVWRKIGGQGFYFIRDVFGNALTIPFGVVGDNPLSSILASSLTTESTVTQEPKNNTGVRLKCNSNLTAAEQGSGFVFKPISDSDQKLAVIFPANTQGQIKKVALVRSDPDKDVVVETLRFVGNLNGGRPTFRASKPGSSYPANVILVKQDQGNNLECMVVADPSKRIG